jgi:hypothetical protein
MANKSEVWEEYESVYKPIYHKLREQVKQKTKPLSLPPSLKQGKDELQVLLFIRKYGLAAVSQVWC